MNFDSDVRSRARRRASVLFGAALGAFSAGCADVADGVDREADAPGASGALESPLAAPAHRSTGCADHEHDDEDPDVRARASRRVEWRSARHRPTRSVALKILGFNDFHGQLSQGRLVAGRPAGGAAVLAAYLKAASADFEGRSLVVHAGDHVGASPPASALLQDEPSIQFLNLLANRHCSYRLRENPRCNLVGTLGNHEFDEGRGELLRLVLGGNHASGPFLESPYRGARFPYVSSNVVSAETGRHFVAPASVKLLGGIPVGVVGAVLKETPTIVTPTGVAGLAFLDEAASISRAVRTLRRGGVRAIVVSIHQGGSQPSFTGPTPAAGGVTGAIVDIVRNLDDEVDLVVSGHAHAFTNALVPNANGKPILVTQAFSSSTAFADIDLAVDSRTLDVTAKSAQIVTTFSDVAPGDTPDPAVAALVAEAEQVTAPLVNRVVAESAAALTRAQNAAGESALGNMIADAQRAALGADLAFMNPGGVRADLDAGPVTWGELFTVQPFGNSLVRLTLSGAQVIELLNQQWLNQPFPRLLSVSGLSYTWAESRPIGDRVVEVLVDGAPIDPAADYSVAVNSFIAAGGDGFVVLAGGRDRLGGPVDLDALIGYVEALPQPFSAGIEGRARRLP